MDLAQAKATGAASFAGRGIYRVGLTRAEHGAVVASADRTTVPADGAVSPAVERRKLSNLSVVSRSWCWAGIVTEALRRRRGSQMGSESRTASIGRGCSRARGLEVVSTTTGWVINSVATVPPSCKGQVPSRK